MRSSWLIFLLAASAANAGATEPCQPIAGLEPLIQPGAVLLLGEIHGTTQSPAFAGQVACLAAQSGLPVVVGLELHVSGQERVDEYLDSPGEANDRRALLAGPDWSRQYQDGRNSQAMLELIERIGRLRRAGLPARAFLFDPGNAGGGQARDRGMANHLAERVARETEAMTIVLTGNLHSRTSRGRFANADYEPMGYLLTQATAAGRIVSLNQAHGGGTAWICNQSCGVTELSGRRGERDGEIEIGEDKPAGHDGWYRVGRITASPPARLSPAERESLVTKMSPRPLAETSLPGVPATEEPTSSKPLSAAEKRMQGRWQGYDHRQGFKTWSLEVEGRRFHAEGSGEWYDGRLVVRGDRQPGWMDFVIETGQGPYTETTSLAVFGWDGEALLVAATAPGNPRPDRLDAGGAQLLRFVNQGLSTPNDR